jgi:SulP family sulfate permease
MQRPLPGLTLRNLGTEAIAGVTLLAIAVPLNIGYAQIAGLPASAGLYALILPSIVYAITVTSRQLVASPDAAAAALVASSVGGLAAAGSKSYMTMVLAQAIISGVLFIACAVFKLGFLANFLSKPILIGFVGGLALDILVSQVAKMLGVHINSGGEFVEKLGDLITGIGKTNLWSLLISVVSIIILVIGRRIARVVPWALVVLILMTILMVTTGLEDAGVSVLGKIDAGFPTLTWPVLNFADWLKLVPSAIALTLVTMAEGLLVARSYGEKRGYPVNGNRDLFSFGIANIAAGATGGFAVGSSTSRTAAMDQSGSRTQLPSLVVAVGTLLLVVFGTALLADIPSPAIGAIVTIAILPLLGFPEFARLWKQDRFEFIVGAACFLGALLLGPIAGIVIAFVLSLINLANRASKPAVDILEANDNPSASLLESAPAGQSTAPGVAVIRFAAPLFFANASTLAASVRSVVSQKDSDVVHVVLDMESVTDIDVTGAESLAELRDWAREKNVSLAYTRLRVDMIERLRHFGLLDGIDTFDTNRDAIAALRVDVSPGGPQQTQATTE